MIVTFKRAAKDSSTVQVEANLSPTYHQLVTNLSDQVKALVMCLDKDSKSVPELQELINLSLKSRRLFKEQFINPALEQGLVEMTHPDQPNHPKQQYRLTEKAKTWKHTHNE